MTSCCICLEPVTEEANPNSCTHQFCFVCLFQWSKVATVCPLCKSEFTSIHRKGQSPLHVETRKARSDVYPEDPDGFSSDEYDDYSSGMDDFIVYDDDSELTELEDSFYEGFESSFIVGSDEEELIDLEPEEEDIEMFSLPPPNPRLGARELERVTRSLSRRLRSRRAPEVISLEDESPTRWRRARRVELFPPSPEPFQEDLVSSPEIHSNLDTDMESPPNSPPRDTFPVLDLDETETPLRPPRRRILRRRTQPELPSPEFVSLVSPCAPAPETQWMTKKRKRDEEWNHPVTPLAERTSSTSNILMNRNNRRVLLTPEKETHTPNRKHRLIILDEDD